MRTFKTDKTSTTSPFENPVPIEFAIDDDVFVAYPPTEGQVAYMMAAQSSGREIPDQIAGVLDFFTGMLDEDGAELFRKRFTDRNDRVDFVLVQNIIEALIEDWSERPTKPSPASSRSRRSTGAKSTAKPRSKE